jgi:hypothetical protein
MNRHRDEELWIDFLEGELDESLQQDLTVLLANSEEQQGTLKTYQSLRKSLEDSDIVDIPEDELYHKRLHAKIMQGIEGTEVQSPLWTRIQKSRTVIYAVAATVIMVMGLSLWLAVQDQLRTGFEGQRMAFCHFSARYSQALSAKPGFACSDRLLHTKIIMTL